ncbi:MAG TPA: MBL fold metallo-hydrolase [Pyrinomonadaceae bacterium]|nr:MBL fold metallo-hydrolase [Pyrinomonadaceae bacterium]
MSIRFTVLGSGSSGNCVLISTETTHVLVDAGLSAREILKRLGAVGVDPDKLDGIIITHEHSDHIGGLRNLLGQVKCNVYVSAPTKDAYYWTRPGHVNGENEAVRRKDRLKDRSVEIDSNTDFCIGNIDFEPFTVPHDAVDNFGFVAKSGGVRVAALTDFGHITQLIREKLRGCDAIMIESNHSRDMLRACSVYTWSLKQRIASQRGHLSNEDLADWLQNEFDGTARHIVLAHLSQRANEPNLARITAECALKMRPPLFPVETKISLTHHAEPTAWFEF